jgi:hypothetical protein
MHFYFAFYCDVAEKAEDKAAQRPVNTLFIILASAYLFTLIRVISKHATYSRRRKVLTYTLLTFVGLILLPAYILSSLWASPHWCDS